MKDQPTGEDLSLNNILYMSDIINPSLPNSVHTFELTDSFDFQIPLKGT